MLIENEDVHSKSYREKLAGVLCLLKRRRAESAEQRHLETKNLYWVFIPKVKRVWYTPTLFCPIQPTRSSYASPGRRNGSHGIKEEVSPYSFFNVLSAKPVFY